MAIGQLLILTVLVALLVSCAKSSDNQVATPPGQPAGEVKGTAIDSTIDTTVPSTTELSRLTNRSVVLRVAANVDAVIGQHVLFFQNGTWTADQKSLQVGYYCRLDLRARAELKKSDEIQIQWKSEGGSGVQHLDRDGKYIGTDYESNTVFNVAAGKAAEMNCVYSGNDPTFTTQLSHLQKTFGSYADVVVLK